ncbi:MAG: TRAP transporter small permease [Deltaproteobacteria bacterium]|nr:TRAP transporter small permease [Deltaproteobacteria bacterium]
MEVVAANAKHELSQGPKAPPEPGIISALRAVDRGLAKAEEIALVSCLVVLVLLGVYQAWTRNVMPPCPFWIDELIRYSVFFIGLLGAALAAQSDSLINIDMLTRLLSPRARMVVRIVTAMFTVYVCWLLVRGGLALRQIVADEKGEIIRTGTAVMALPLAATLIGLHVAIHAFVDAFYLITNRPPPPQEPIFH